MTCLAGIDHDAIKADPIAFALLDASIAYADAMAAYENEPSRFGDVTTEVE